MEKMLNSLPKENNLDWSKLKACADDEINVNEKIEIWLENGRKHCGKKEKMLVTSIFSFSYNVFKSFFSRSIKSRCCGRVETQHALLSSSSFLPNQKQISLSEQHLKVISNSTLDIF